MRQTVTVHLDYALKGPTDLLLQIEVPDLPDQRISDRRFVTSETEHEAEVAAEDGIGNRRWLRAEDRFVCDYSATVEVDRPALDLSGLSAVPPHLLPPLTVRHVMPSRYCPSDEFHALVSGEFPGLAGGALVAAMRDWIEENFSYVPGSSNAQTTAPTARSSKDRAKMVRRNCQDASPCRTLRIRLSRSAAMPSVAV